MKEKLSVKFLANVGITAVVAGASAALGVLGGANVSKSVVIAAGIVFIRVACGVASAALGGSSFPGQGDEAV